MARWAAMEPAAALVVPRPEKKIGGLGEIDFRDPTHADVGEGS